MADRLEEIKARAKKATSGPWAWRGQIDGSIELRTLHSGGLRIVSTSRAHPCIVTTGDWMEGDMVVHLASEACASCRKAYEHTDLDERVVCEKPENLDTVWVWAKGGFIEPINRYAVREVPYRGDVAAVAHPDAEFLAASRTDVDWLIAEVEKLRALADEYFAEAAEVLRG